MKLRQLMTNQVEAFQPGSTLTEVAKAMEVLDVGIVPVCDGDRLIGVCTDRDIVLRAVTRNSDAATTTVRDCMSTPPITATPDMDAHEAASLMAQNQVRRLPVVDGDRLVGMVSLGDLAVVDIHENEAGEALSQISVPDRPHP